ncbi:unnamed protein product [Brassica oleracea var. botrytis]|uniref:(rape) hypothetical protein n=1 Tax=Brassica napus TaxID=3708 RepID=A0A816IRU7_BRANA|nr:unnamed protein product [Brassica napus]
MEVVKEKSSGTDGISVGENFTPARGKGFLIGSRLCILRFLEKLKLHSCQNKKVGGYVEDTIVVEFLIPPPS